MGTANGIKKLKNEAGEERHNRVLLVDDDPVALRLMRLVLNGEGIEAVTATDALSAITLAHEEPFDAMFLDLKMRPVNGLDVLRRTRGAVPCRYVLTGYADAEEEREAIRLGATSVLHKPLDLDRFISLVREPCQPNPRTSEPD